MKCSQKSGSSLIPYSCFWWFFLLCTGLSWSFAAGSGNSSTYQYIYNLTICELNGTAWMSANFPWVVETFVLYPVATHILSLGFLTTSHFFDALGLGAVSVTGFYDKRYVLSSIYGTCALAAFACFVIRVAKNCMACRYARTRFTNFIVDDRGRIHRWKSPVVVEKLGKAEIGSSLVTIKHVVLEGVKAQPLVKTPAEQWEA
uniref:GP5 n=1 Tax=Porcine reproductive and respiratory syndrome virus TaxID=28344 RepID=A0A8G1G526_PRRSV|nr:GP5 [Porcine reproductive and respiratory syndrome virus]QZA57974.1 GP5 [Porcine reproductive and respiratory syndrome virus]QZA57976.1 GP5 [Porcine reproductive and respiratory syndrome virus]QZA57978.1 GP5 [Porcine reproductive and respiratory syndrome virus]QZA57981.1 GP5 [Porcine reproductive and respiratory syndrome virus]